MILSVKDMIIDADFKDGAIRSLKIKGIECLAARAPLFCVCLRDTDGGAIRFTALDAGQVTETEDGAIYSGFGIASLSVRPLHL